MTMTVAITHKDLLLVASDTRRTWTYQSGQLGYADDAGKVIRLRSGWLTATGDATLQQRVFSALSPDADSREEIGGTIAAVRDELVRTGAWQVDDFSFFTWTRRGDPCTVTVFDVRGEVYYGDGKGEDNCISWPPGLAETDREQVQQALKEAIPRAETLIDLVRLVAAAYQIVAAKTSYISREMVLCAEIAGHPPIELLRRPTRWFITTPEQEIVDAAADKPVAAHCAAGSISTDKLSSLESVPTRGIRLNPATARPASWTEYIDMCATGSDPLLQFPAVTIRANGTADFRGSFALVGGGIIASDADMVLEATDNVLIQSTSGGSMTIGNGTGPVTINGGSDGVRVGALGTQVGFFGANGSTRPVVTGSRGGNAALASLLNALALLGLITNNTTP